MLPYLNSGSSFTRRAAVCSSSSSSEHQFTVGTETVLVFIISSFCCFRLSLSRKAASWTSRAHSSTLDENQKRSGSLLMKLLLGCRLCWNSTSGASIFVSIFINHVSHFPSCQTCNCPPFTHWLLVLILSEPLSVGQRALWTSSRELLPLTGSETNKNNRVFVVLHRLPPPFTPTAAPDLFTLSCCLLRLTLKGWVSVSLCCSME